MQGKLVRQVGDIQFPGQRKADITEVSTMMKMLFKGIRKKSGTHLRQLLPTNVDPFEASFSHNPTCLFELETTLNWSKLIG